MNTSTAGQGPPPGGWASAPGTAWSSAPGGYTAEDIDFSQFFGDRFGGGGSGGPDLGDIFTHFRKGGARGGAKSKRGGDVTYAACMVAATTRANVNGLARQHLGARKASFGQVDVVTSLTGMEYGGITPIGLPASWAVLVDDLVAKIPSVVIGSGIRGSKLWLPGSLLAELPSAEILPGLGVEAG